MNNANQKQIITPEVKEFFIGDTPGSEILKNKEFNKEIAKFNNKVDKYEDTYKVKEEEAKQKANNINDNIVNLEIKAIGSGILVYTLAKNPFTKTEMIGNILIDTSITPTYKSNETGEVEKEESFIHFGTVFDVGPECKWIKEGDIIMWTKPSEIPIPFYSRSIVQVPEQRVLCVVNEGLTKRFNSNEVWKK